MSESKYKPAIKSVSQSICQRVIWHLFNIPSETEKEEEKFILKMQLGYKLTKVSNCF